MAKFVFLAIAFFAFGQLSAQSAKPKVDSTHSPKKAALLSAALPGTGQLYNKKYWKAPLVYAGMGVSVFFIISNQKSHKEFRQEYAYRMNTGSIGGLEAYTDNDLLVIQEQYRRLRDLSVVGAFVIYLLQIADASVDAHMLKFDISEDLSMHFNPSFVYGSKMPGLGIRLNF
jgi:hypothetical protein